MQSLPLFVNKKEIFITLFIVAALFFLSLSFEFYKYKDLTTYSLHRDNFKIVNLYEKTSKNGKKFTLLNLKNSHYGFFTPYFKQSNFSIGDNVDAVFRTDKITFYTYLKSFFAYNKLVEIKEKMKSIKIVNYFQNQHKSSNMKQFYSALYFAQPISKELRADISKFGISHLIAISGFHLGILSAILFILIKPIYTLFQDRFFPYRNSKADIALVVFVLLYIYIDFIGFIPSVLRAFVMSLFGYFLFSKNIKILSFATLLFTIGIILTLFPHLIFSLSFWLSVSGVFYIFLFLHYFSHINKLLIFVFLNIFVFIMMLPVAHYFFYDFTKLQFISPIISMLFTIFYPLSLALHVIGFGGLLDGVLNQMLSLHVEHYILITPLWFLVSFITLSLFSIRFKLVFYTLPLISALLYVV